MNTRQPVLVIGGKPANGLPMTISAQIDSPSQPMKPHRISVIPQTLKSLRTLIQGKEAYEQTFGIRIADGIREGYIGPEVSAEYRARWENLDAPDDPWKDGFLVMDTTENIVVGCCGYVGPPGADGMVEIAYGTAPAFQGRGYATEAARWLINHALADDRVRIVRAHTLPGPNASTRILEKCGFSKTGEITDPVDGLIWRWERKR